MTKVVEYEPWRHEYNLWQRLVFWTAVLVFYVAWRIERLAEEHCER